MDILMNSNYLGGGGGGGHARHRAGLGGVHGRDFNQLELARFLILVLLLDFDLVLVFAGGGNGGREGRKGEESKW